MSNIFLNNWVILCRKALASIIHAFYQYHNFFPHVTIISNLISGFKIPTHDWTVNQVKKNKKNEQTCRVPLLRCNTMAFLVLNQVLRKGNLIISSESLGVILAPAWNAQEQIITNATDVGGKKKDKLLHWKLLRKSSGSHLNFLSTISAFSLWQRIEKVSNKYLNPTCIAVSD